MPRFKVLDLSVFPDCSGLSDNGRCIRLNVTRCQGEKCSFKRTHEDEDYSIKRSYQRLLSLDKSQQAYIAHKYFDGCMPWDERESVEHTEKMSMEI